MSYNYYADRKTGGINWIDGEGLKKPKCNSSRQSIIPKSVQDVIDVVKAQARHIDGFVFESAADGKPLSGAYFGRAVAAELQKIGISSETQKERNISYHSLRHTFITLAKISGISDVEVQAISGHTNERTSKRYTHAAQVLDFTAARLKFESLVG